MLAFSGAPQVTGGASVLNTPCTTGGPLVVSTPKYVKGQAQYGNSSGLYCCDPPAFVPNLQPGSLGNIPRRLS